MFGVNGEDKGVFFSGVDTRRMLWGMVDVYGNSNVIELVDPRRTLNNICSSKNAPQVTLTEIKMRRSDSCEKVCKLSEESCRPRLRQELPSTRLNSAQPLSSQRSSSSKSNRNSSSNPKSCSRQSSPAHFNQSDVQTACVICYESDVDCVLYSCGHMCMCYQCATQQWSVDGE